MFTGLVEHVGRVVQAGGGRITVDLGECARGLQAGQSVAVDGACLTLVSLDGTLGLFDVGPETAARTTLGDVHRGDAVHIERAVPVGGRLEGHMVLGHVDAVAEVAARRDVGRSVEMVLRVPGSRLELVAEKGSVAVAGVSLTVNRVAGDRFWVVLVPHTLARTHLGEARPGRRLNVEYDVLARYAARLLEARRPGVDLRALEEYGFA